MFEFFFSFGFDWTYVFADIHKNIRSSIPDSIKKHASKFWET